MYCFWAPNFPLILSISSLQRVCYILSVEGTEETLLVKQDFWFQFLLLFFLILLHNPSAVNVWDIQGCPVCCLLVALQISLLTMTSSITMPVKITCQLQWPLPTQKSCTSDLLPQCFDTLYVSAHQSLAHRHPKLSFSSSIVTLDQLWPQKCRKLINHFVGCNYILSNKVWTPAWCRSTLLPLIFLGFSVSALGSWIGICLSAHLFPYSTD